MNIKRSFMLEVMNNTFLYQLYFYLYRNRVGVKVPLPKGDRNLYLDGFQRSGNTFSLWLIRNVLQDNIRLSHHLHTVAGLKLALKNSIPAYILIRDPKDCIASFVIMQEHNTKGSPNDPGFIDEIIIRYIQYYRYVLKNSHRLRVVQFQELINAPVDLMVELAARFNLDKDSSTIRSTYDSAIGVFRDRKKREPAQLSSLPNKARDEWKEKVKEAIIQSAYFSEAQSLYQTIVEKTK